MNKPNISTCLFIWKHVLTGVFNYPINLQHLSFQFLWNRKPYSIIVKDGSIFCCDQLFFGQIAHLSSATCTLIFKIPNYWMVWPYLHCTKVWTTKNKGRGAYLCFETILFELWHKRLLPSKLNSCFRHQRVYEKSMQKRGNLRKP